MKLVLMLFVIGLYFFLCCCVAIWYGRKLDRELGAALDQERLEALRTKALEDWHDADYYL